MFDFLMIYGIIGFMVSIVLNLINWAGHKPALSFIEILSCLLFWPSVIVGFIKATDENFEE
jgi:hypothetical protein